MHPKPRAISQRRRWPKTAIVMAAGLLISGPVDALQRTIRSKVANHMKSPVTLTMARMRLVETTSTPTQAALVAMDHHTLSTRMTRSTVRVLNRRNQEVPLYVLEGHLDVKNQTRKPVQVFQVTAVFFDAFRNTLGDDQQTIDVSIEPMETKSIRWTKPLPDEDVFEVFFVVTGARFGDEMIWNAPEEELVLIP